MPIITHTNSSQSWDDDNKLEVLQKNLKYTNNKEWLLQVNAIEVVILQIFEKKEKRKRENKYIYTHIISLGYLSN